MDSADTAITTATSSGADLADGDQRDKPEAAPEQRPRNYAWSELMKRVFNQPTNCIACSRSVRPCPDHSSVPSALRAGNRFRQSYTAMGEDWVVYRNPDEYLLWLPARWTSVEAEDPFIVVSAGRSHFRAADLIDLAALIAAFRRGEAADGV